MALPPGPLSYALKIDVGREHSCSQSEESFGELGTFALEVDARGAATLDLDLFLFHRFGSGHAAGRGLNPPPQRNDSSQRTRWTGAAVRQEEQVIVKFSAAASSAEL